MRKTTLIYNPAAGGKPQKRERQIRQAVAALRAAGIEVELAATTGPGSAVQLAREAAGTAGTLVLACGGDGTVNEVANGLARRSATLGILPGGTANILAKELSLPHDPVRAARELPTWRPRRVPLGKARWSGAGAAGQHAAQERYFVSVAGVGFDAYVVRKLDPKNATAFGVFAYGWEALRQLFRYPFPRFKAQAEGDGRWATFAVALRSRNYAGWLRMAPRRNFFRVGMTLCLFESPKRLRYLAYAAAVLAGRHARLHDVGILETQDVNFVPGDDRAPVFFELDGELAGQLPLRLDVEPNALTLLVP